MINTRIMSLCLHSNDRNEENSKEHQGEHNLARGGYHHCEYPSENAPDKGEDNSKTFFGQSPEFVWPQ